jgi:hypothetical protein
LRWIADRDTGSGGFLTDEEFIHCQLAKANKGWGFNIPLTKFPVTLQHDKSVSGAVLDRHGSPRHHRQFFGAVSGILITNPIFIESF